MRESPKSRKKEKEAARGQNGVGDQLFVRSLVLSIGILLRPDREGFLATTKLRGGPTYYIASSKGRLYIIGNAGLDVWLRDAMLRLSNIPIDRLHT